MKRLIFLTKTTGVLLIIMLLSNGCKKKLSVEAPLDYGYTVEKTSVAKSIQIGETVSLQFAMVRNQPYEGAAFRFRYSQTAGNGKLFQDSNLVYEMNSDYMIPADGKIKLFYTSQCEVPQVLNFVFTDKFGKKITDTVKFEVKALPDRSFRVELLPVKETIWSGEPVPLDFKIICNNPYAGAAYKYRYFQSNGTGKLTLPDNTLINGNQNYTIGSDGRLLCSYVSTSHIKQKLNFVFEDALGHKVEYPVEFNDRPYPYFTINLQPYDSIITSNAKRKDLYFSISGTNSYESKVFKYKYKVLKGDGWMKNGANQTLAQNQLYPLDASGQFFLTYCTYIGGTHNLQIIVEDVYGNQIDYLLTLIQP